MEHVSDLMDLIGDKLAGMAKSDLVEGSPISLGKVTVVPVSRVSVGFGGGGGEGEGEGPDEQQEEKGSRSRGHGRGRGSGGGSGGGGQVRPVAVAVFTEDAVEVLTIPERESTLDKIFQRVPDLIDRFKK